MTTAFILDMEGTKILVSLDESIASSRMLIYVTQRD
jgi:hypothetical protein